ncbi:hypothetical protein JDV02_008285 [Purpureocillium takamizusanense]|uniref:Uncharacterized protein n=1 Tax=Purpureocillium takamizusanense TaxID=2060973 RepID=A0A9Q8QLT4_9HYPO|nr:uncharacterized protein JDV02_008285 [Purpureocillium takamizusanense]UNI22393.1 hypothetical protein JDV02_008285 [Purpureocillium takamizusanense]
MIDGHLQGDARRHLEVQLRNGEWSWERASSCGTTQTGMRVQVPTHEAQAASMIKKAREASDWVQASLPGRGIFDMLSTCMHRDGPRGGGSDGHPSNQARTHRGTDAS